MREDEDRTALVPKRIPWNKGKLIGPDRRYGKSMSGQYEPGSRSID